MIDHREGSDIVIKAIYLWVVPGKTAEYVGDRPRPQISKKIDLDPGYSTYLITIMFRI